MAQQTILETGLSVALLTAVVFFAGTEPISFAVVEALLLVLACLLLFSPQRELHSNRPPVLIPALLLGIILLQLMPLPRGFLNILHAGLGGTAAPSFAPLSLAPYATETQLLHWAAYLAAFYLALAAGRRSGGLRRLAFVLIFLAAVESIWGIAQFLGDWQPFAATVAAVPPLGTYVDHDHFAGLLEMIFPFALAMTFCQSEAASRTGSTGMPVALRNFLAGRNSGRLIFWFFLSAILFLGIVSSLSRTGIACGLLGAGLVIFLAVSTLRRRRLGSLLGAGFLCVLLCLTVWIGLQPVLERYMRPNPFAGRVDMWRETLAVIRQSPVAGVGMGALVAAIPAVQTADLNLEIDHAHNDYLEYAAEIGVPAALAVFASFFWVFWRNLRALYRRRGGPDRMIALGAAGALGAIFVHSLVDFNLHLPANALVFAVVLAMAYQGAAPRAEAA